MNRPALALAAGVVALSCGCASTGDTTDGAADYPENLSTLTLVVPFSAGGTTDSVARVLAPLLEEELGAPVQILNLPERDGQAGFERLADAGPDGSLIGFTNVPSAAATYVGSEASYDRDSFVSLGAVTSLSTVVGVHADSEFQDFGDLVDAALAAPGQVTLAAGALDDRIQVHQIEETTGAVFNKIPFEGGASGEITALLGRKVDAILTAPVAMVPNVESGDFRVVAIFGPDRIGALPDAPTSGEQGVDLRMQSRIGLSAPAGTTTTVTGVLTDALRRVADLPEFQDRMAALGYEGGFVEPEELDADWVDAEELTRTVIEEER